MGFGHIYVKAEQDAVLASMDGHLQKKGFVREEMTPEKHPKKMKEMHENDMRLFWISPRLGDWTGLFEFRYYNNEMRERWGYTDAELAARLSKEVGTAYRMEVIDTSGFWLYGRYEGGEEKEGNVYQDNPAERSPDQEHPRYLLNRIIEKEGIRNISLAYENIPGPPVAPVENCAFWKDGIEGLEGFVHRAYIHPKLPGPDEDT